MRYYYSLLPKSSRNGYVKLLNGLSNFNSVIDLPLMNMRDAEKLLRAIRFDYPDLYNVDFTQMHFLQTPLGVKIKPEYRFSSAEYKNLRSQIDAEVGKIVQSVSGKNEYDTVLALHDWFVENVTYDYDSLNDPSKGKWANTMVGAILHKKAVCEGIAKSFLYILNLLNIKCVLVTGESRNVASSSAPMPHAWNILKIDNKSVQFDVTWDICLSGQDGLRHDYFAISDSMMAKDHTWSGNVPKCPDESLSYYYRQNALVSQKADLTRLVRNAALKLKRSVTFRLADNVNVSTQKLLNTCSEELSHIPLLGAHFRVNCTENPTQKVYTLSW